MAFFPCDYGPHYNPRQNHLFYVGRSLPGDTSRWRLRFCAQHTAIVQEDLSEYKVDAENFTVRAGDGPRSQCLSCGKPAGQVDWQLFVTAYPTKDEREDYWTRLHIDCQLPEHLRNPDYNTP